MALDRQRHAAVFWLVIAGVWLVIAVFGGFSSVWWLRWFYVALAIATGVDGVRRLLLALRARRAFEAEHGRDAGVQKPV